MQYSLHSIVRRSPVNTTTNVCSANMINKIAIVLSVAVAVCSARPNSEIEERQLYEPQPYKSEPQYKQGLYKEEPAKPYAFDYGVRDDYSGANYGHSETSNGNTVEGSYQVALPDGRIQKVTYVADHINGFQAQVEYEGEARYPEHVPQKEQPSYKPESSYKQTYKPQPHKPSYKQAPQYHPSQAEQQPHQIEEAPIYHSELQEYN